MAPAACDILITNACVLSMDAKRTIYRPGAIAIAGRDILMVGAERDVALNVAPKRVIDAGGAVAHPGFVEAHYHTTMHLTRGSISDDPKRPAVGTVSVEPAATRVDSRESTRRPFFSGTIRPPAVAPNRPYQPVASTTSSVSQTALFQRDPGFNSIVSLRKARRPPYMGAVASRRRSPRP